MRNLITASLILLTFGHVNGQADTLRSQNHYYFLADIKLRTAGQLILSDSIAPSDNYITFSCMDSITSKNKDTRDYFFPVFRKIVDKSDGALAEVVGSYVLEYVKKYPKELADRFKCYSTSQLCRYEFKRLALYAGEEIMMRNERQKEYDELINHMTKNYKDWRKDKKLTIFIETVDDTRQKWTD